MPVQSYQHPGTSEETSNTDETEGVTPDTTDTTTADSQPKPEDDNPKDKATAEEKPEGDEDKPKDGEGDDKDKAEAYDPGKLPEHLQKYSEEFTEKGELSEASFKELAEKHGLTEAYVRTYIEGVKATQEANNQRVFAAVGGKENYDALSAWVVDNIPQDEIDAYNEALDSGNAAKVTTILRGFHAAYKDAEGSDPQLVKGDTRPSPTDAPYQSKDEMMEDMRSDAYRKDPAFREKVRRRLANSSVV